MTKISLILGLSLLAPSLAFSAACGPGEVCTYKGVLKAGQDCPASFCQNAYVQGIAAAGQGQVLRIQKSPPPISVELEKVPELKATDISAAVWVDPPSKAVKIFGEQDKPLDSEISAKKLDACRSSKRAYADQSAECKTLLDLQAFGLRGSDQAGMEDPKVAEAKKLEKFCGMIYEGNEADIADCTGTFAAGARAEQMVAHILPAKKVGSSEQACRKKFGSDQDAISRCLGGRTLASRRAVRAKVAVTPGEQGGRGGAQTSMDAE